MFADPLCRDRTDTLRRRRRGEEEGVTLRSLPFPTITCIHRSDLVSLRDSCAALLPFSAVACQHVRPADFLGSLQGAASQTSGQQQWRVLEITTVTETRVISRLQARAGA
ncbi:unnamed protein product [Gadus morhua 'NCC']